MSNNNDDGNILAFLRRDRDGQVATNDTNGGTALRLVAGGRSDTSLLILDGARRELADAKTVDEVKSIRDKAIGLVAYAKQASDRQLEAEAEVIRMEALRKLGQMMQQQGETVGLNKGGRPKTGVRETPVSDQLPTLAEAGIDKNLAKKARAAAALSDEQFQAKVTTALEAVRTRTGSLRRTKRGTRKRCTYLENRLFRISAICRYDDEMELPAHFNAAKVDAAIVTVTGAIDELNKLIRRLEEARPQK